MPVYYFCFVVNVDSKHEIMCNAKYRVKYYHNSIRKRKLKMWSLSVESKGYRRSNSKLELK